MTNVQAVLLYNAAVAGMTAAIWYVVYDRTDSLWSMLVFLLAAVFHQGYREGKAE